MKEDDRSQEAMTEVPNNRSRRKNVQNVTSPKMAVSSMKLGPYEDKIDTTLSNPRRHNDLL